MNYDQLLIKLNQTKIKSIKDNHVVFKALSDSGFGYLEWYYNENICYMNNRVFDATKVEEDSIFLDSTEHIFTPSVKFTVLQTFLSLFSDEKSIVIEVPLTTKNKQIWYKAKFSLDSSKECLLGIFENIQHLKDAERKVAGLSTQIDQFLEIIPLPMYYYDVLGKLIYTNQHHHDDLSHLNKIIEKHVHNQLKDVYEYEWINKFEIMQYTQKYLKFSIEYALRGKMRTTIIHRIEISDIEDISGILYMHEDITDFSVDEPQLNKVLRANEMIIEIKDIVDHANSLSKMYDHLLSKIHTVIPMGKRACILKIDDKDDLYMAAYYGFEPEYVKKMRLPFKESYAFTNLRGNYNRSIIINNIQERYGMNHPEINKIQKGFILESNITTPLVIDDKLYGILSLDSDQSDIFDDVDLNLLDYMKTQIERAIVKFKNISKVKRNSIMDPLTGVFNRRHLWELYDQLAKEASILEKTFSIVVFDLDKLKKINDSYGHIAGDEIIKQFAFIISSEMRQADVFARIGGDEFVGIFWDIRDEILLKKIHHWTETFDNHPIDYEGHKIVTRFSCGIAELNKDGETFEELLKVADKRMYVQKKDKSRT